MSEAAQRAALQLSMNNDKHLLLQYLSSGWQQSSTWDQSFLLCLKRQKGSKYHYALFPCMRMISVMQSVSLSVSFYHCDGSAGAVACDFDGDGRLELLVSHGESAAQPLSVYRVNQVTV